MSDQPNPFRDRRTFVGRESELRRLDSLTADGQSVLLVGGRRTGKTALAERLEGNQPDRTLVRVDAGAWEISSETEVLREILRALDSTADVSHGPTRSELTAALHALQPLTLVIDEADRLLGPLWGRSFLSYLRWLDDKELRSALSLVLVGGPVMLDFRDPDDHGSPPLNTAEPIHLNPLDGVAVVELSSTLGRPIDVGRLVDDCGGHPWLLSQLLADIWSGDDYTEALDRLEERAQANFSVWRRQLGPAGVELLRQLRTSGPLQPTGRARRAAARCRCLCLVRVDENRLVPGPGLYHAWLDSEDGVEPVWDLAVSYASEDEELARSIVEQLEGYRVFFAPREAAHLWAHDLNEALPNTYGVASRYVLALSTDTYVRKYWPRVEFDAALRHDASRVLLVNLGAIPENWPPDRVYVDGSSAGLVLLVSRLRERLHATVGR